MGEEQKSNSIT